MIAMVTHILRSKSLIIQKFVNERSIGKVGQNDDNQGLASYGIAANASAIYQFDPVQALNTGYIGVASTTDVQLLGSLNGVFFTNTSTKKPTWTNHLDASNTATDPT